MSSEQPRSIAQQLIGDFAPKLVELTDDVLFGDVWALIIKSDDKGRELQAKLDPKKLFEDFIASFDFLRLHAKSTGKVGAVGFCYGGGICNALAVACPELSASVPYYGRQPTAAEVPSIKAPLLIHYAEIDERINAGALPYQAALLANQKPFEVHYYPGTQHGFHNDTTPRYDKAAAELSWSRTMAFFAKNLA